MKISLAPLVAGSLAGFVVIHVLILWSARTQIFEGYPDFSIYYTAGTMVRTGMAHQLYDDAAQYRLQQQFAPGATARTAALPFNHPPFEALLFAPFSYLSYRAAYIAWFAFNLALLAAVPILLRLQLPWLGRFPVAAWVLAEFAFFPIFLVLLQGQDSILLLFVYALAISSLQRQHPRSAGAWLACGLFKPQLVLPFVALLILEKPLRDSRKIIVGFATVAAMLALISFALIGPAEFLRYPRFVLNLESTSAHGAIVPADMPTLRGLCSLSTLPHANEAGIAIAVAAFLGAAWILRTGANTGGLRLSLALLVTILVSYHALGYDLAILLPAILLLTQWVWRERSRGWSRGMVAAGVAALLFSPLQVALAMRYNRMAWMAGAVLACAIGAGAELMKAHSSEPTAAPAETSG